MLSLEKRYSVHDFPGPVELWNNSSRHSAPFSEGHMSHFSFIVLSYLSQIRIKESISVWKLRLTSTPLPSSRSRK